MDDVKQLKLTFWTHIKMIWLTLIVYAFFVFMTVFLYAPERPGSLFAFVLPFIFMILPVFYIHYNYNTYNEGVNYELNRNVGITRFDANGNVVYTKNEFDQLKLIATKNKLFGVSGKMLFGNYHYVKLKLKSGEELIFTCLYSPNIYTLLKSYFPEVPTTQHGVFYPNISEFD